MKKFWQIITGLGVSPRLPLNLTKRFRLINQMIFLALSFALLYLSLVITGVLPDQILAPLFMLILFTLSGLWLCYQERHILGGVIAIISGQIFVLAMTLLVGLEVGVHYLYVIILIAPFMVLPYNARGLLVISGLGSTFMMAFVYWWFRDNTPYLGLPARDIPLFHYLITGTIFAFLAIIGYYLFTETHRTEEELEKEQHRSDYLLRNILPETIANELKTNDRIRPRLFESVSVLFTDFEGFTRFAESMEPEDLIRELDESFTAFDHIIEKFGLEKLKTIGDGYMAVAGVPTPREDHAWLAIQAAREMLDFHRERMRKKEEQGIPHWDLRVGIHSGPVIGGIIGRNKFIYDVWGDAVNTASRMESSGVAGAINISKTTRKLVGRRITVRRRGKIEVKHKGGLEMYIVRSLRAD